MEHYAGIDVSLEQSSVCVVDAKGRKELRYAPPPIHAVDLFRCVIPSLWAVDSIVFCPTRGRFDSRWRSDEVCHDDAAAD
jgi:hypothetical protein